MPDDDLNLDAGLVTPAPQRAKPTTSHLDELSEFAKKFNLTMGSTTGGTHNRGSLHYSGNAFDVKNSGGFDNARVTALKQAASEFGLLVRDERTRPKGQKVWGGPHIHIEKAGGDDPLNLDAGLTVENLDAGYADTPTRPTSAASSRSAYNSAGRAAVNAPNLLDKLARDIEWHFGYGTLASFDKLAPEKQQQIAQLATQYAAEDEVKKKLGIVLNPSPAWQLANQRKVDAVEGVDFEVRNRPDVAAKMDAEWRNSTALRKAAEDNVFGFTLDPITNIRHLVGAARSGDKYFANEVAQEEENLRAQQARSQTPEMQSIRKEYGRMSATTRSVAASTISAGGDILKLVGGITSLAGIAPNRLSDWANKRGQIVQEAAASTPLTEMGDEIQRQLPEKVVSALIQTGLSIAEIVLLKKATGMPLGRLLALETALKTSDQPLEKRASQVAESYVMGRVLERHLSRSASTLLFGAPTAVREGHAYLRGDISLEDAILQTGVQTGVGLALGGGKTEKGVERPATLKDFDPLRETIPEELQTKLRAADTTRFEQGRAAATERLTRERNAELKKSTPLGTVAPEVKLPERSTAASDDALLNSLVEKKSSAALVTSTEPPKFAGQEGSATLGASVLGADKFIQHDIAPIGRGVVDTVRSVVRLLSPKTGVKREATDLLMGMKGQRDKAEFIVTEQGRAARKMFDKLPTTENVAFMDRIKQGQTQPTPEMQTIADTYRPLEDDLNTEVRKFKPSAAYLENHFRVFWKVLPGAQSAKGFAGLFKRPLQGSKGFLKQHTLNTVSEGIARGGVPVSYNPQTLFEMNYADTMKFITAQRMWQGLKDAGLAKFVKTGRSIPDGFTRLSDPLAKVYFPTDAGLVNTGEWFVDEGAGRLLNNHLSRNYITEAAAGKGAMAIKNQMTQLELGFSLFHAAFVSSEAASSTLGLGMRRFVNLGILRGSPKEMLKGVGEMAKAPYAYFPSINVPISTYATGAKAFRYLVDKESFLNTTHGRSFIKAFPEADAMLNDLFTGGGKLRMWEGYRTNTTESFKKAINDGNYPGALLRSLPALNETVMKPLFDVFIPRMKVGQFLQEYSLALQEKAPQLASGELTRPELARKTWNFVEDRFGEMNFDNLFWDNTFKSAMQLMWRSTTWKLGNLRATLGAVPEQATEVYRAVKGGRAPQLEPKMAWLAGQSIVTALLGTIVMKMFTGKYPQTLTDLAFPQVDPNDPKRRLSVPTYVRDTVSMKHDPSGYVAGAASAEFSRSMESWKNRDFSGQQVYDPQDPAYWKAAEIVKHFFPVPFSVSNYRKAVQEGRPTREQAAGFFGFMKAPAWLGKTQWELDIDEAAYKNVPQVGRSPEAMKRSQTKNLLIERRRQGDQTAMGEANKLEHSGQLTPRDVSEIRSAWHRTELQVKFGRMELEDAERIFPTMPPEAQKEVLPVIEEKRHNRGLPRKAAPSPTPVGGT